MPPVWFSKSWFELQPWRRLDPRQASSLNVRERYAIREAVQKAVKLDQGGEQSIDFEGHEVFFYAGAVVYVTSMRCKKSGIFTEFLNHSRCGRDCA